MAREDIPPLEWALDKETETEVGKSIADAYRRSVTTAEKAIQWYQLAKKAKRFPSNLLRILAITAGIVGGLAPVIAGFGGLAFLGVTISKDFVAQEGYLLIAIAAGLLLADRYTGLSSGWIRYVITQTQIQSLLADFQFEWAELLDEARAQQPNTAAKLKMQQRARAFNASALNLVSEETKAWAAEFQSNIADLQAMLMKQRDEAKAASDVRQTKAEEAKAASDAAAKAGSLNVLATSAEKIVSGTVKLGRNGPELELKDGSRAFDVVEPGRHTVALAVKFANATAQYEEVVKIEAGELVTFKHEFPKPA